MTDRILTHDFPVLVPKPPQHSRQYSSLFVEFKLLFAKGTNWFYIPMHSMKKRLNSFGCALNSINSY